MMDITNIPLDPAIVPDPDTDARILHELSEIRGSIIRSQALWPLSYGCEKRYMQGSSYQEPEDVGEPPNMVLESQALNKSVELATSS